MVRERRRCTIRRSRTTPLNRCSPRQRLPPSVSALMTEDDVSNAERHLLLGTRSSPPILAKLLYDYFLEDEPHKAGHYISRAVLPYLCLQNLRDAQVALNTFVTLLTNGHYIPPHSKIEGVEIFPSLPHINFLSLLLVACQRGAPEFFNNLKRQYSQSLEEVPWNDVPPKILPFVWGC
jgi:golgi to ER traffic protein 4